MEKVYTIEGLVVAFGTHKDAEKFRRWYNKKFGDEFYIEPEDIKGHYSFFSAEEAIEWSTQPEGFMY